MKIDEVATAAEDRHHWRGVLRAANPSYGGRHWTTTTTSSIATGRVVTYYSYTTLYSYVDVELNKRNRIELNCAALIFCWSRQQCGWNAGRRNATQRGSEREASNLTGSIVTADTERQETVSASTCGFLYSSVWTTGVFRLKRWRNTIASKQHF